MYGSLSGDEPDGPDGPVQVEPEGGPEGWSVNVSIDTDSDGQPDIRAGENSDGEWDAEYIFDNGISVGVSNHNDAGDRGTFGSVTIPF